ncbi:hypothetical protein [Gracilimonas amylolytica]|uniref:hypothetical protein n=1 Tax=Gracilimonas amylolytica TaxID=1749045 RepID=UPI000CD812F4|nr:hypothetical protein [Gracilimonas amylolytica]
MNKYIYILIIFVLSSSGIMAQQRPDTTFVTEFEKPIFAKGQGPAICIDAAHNNFHTSETGFAPFSKVLRLDGFVIRSVTETLQMNLEPLKDCQVFVVANPLHESNINNWRLPNPSAFTQNEIDRINDWVNSGGSLFLIADHMPFAGAAEKLGRSFGFEFNNSFASLEKEQNEPDQFNQSNGRLVAESLPDKSISSITTFTGSAFEYPSEANPILLFKEGDFSLEPEIAWQFNDSTKSTSLEGYSQGAIMDYGGGKLAVFGEAAMFTAQVIDTPQGEFKVGLNNKEMAPQNLEFLRSLMKWLSE